jgi:hypothetical protein
MREGKPTSILSWMGSFRDPMLNGRIKTGYTNDLSLQAGGVRFFQARAQLNQSVGKSIQNTA